MKTAVIYHDADFDGKLSRDVCLHALRFEEGPVHAYGWDYGKPIPEPVLGEWAQYDLIYIVDLSVEPLMAREDLEEKIVWIDHHKSAIDLWGKTKFAGYRIDGVAACRLAWQWFLPGRESDILPEKADFVARRVSEPRILQLAGEHDIWDHRDSAAKPLQFGLRSLDENQLRCLVDAQFKGKMLGDSLLQETIKTGRQIMDYVRRQQDEYSAAYATTLVWEGLRFCCLNIGQRGNSDLLAGGLKPEHQACFAWRHDGERVNVSLYHAPGHTDLDLSVIATKYGGGGHRGACGFRIPLSVLDEILTTPAEEVANPKPRRRKAKEATPEPAEPAADLTTTQEAAVTEVVA
jgi:single-stranded DNA-specific DHH superfamily exonuclease